jgi:hypothetical protein
LLLLLLLLQVDSLEQALLAALPLGPQGAAGGVSLPDLFRVRHVVYFACTLMGLCAACFACVPLRDGRVEIEASCALAAAWFRLPGRRRALLAVSACPTCSE